MALALNSLNGSNGFIVTGETGGGHLGWGVSGAGDFNGDGLQDFIVSAYLSNANGASAGAAYIVYGTLTGLSSPFSVSSLNGANGFQLNGAAGQLAGSDVSVIGDFNGDGYDDVVIGARGASSNDGAAFVVFGGRSGFGANFNLSSLNGSNGFALTGVVGGGGQLGVAVANAGDVNGDGFDDFIVGASNLTTGVGSAAGGAYVVFGAAGGFSASLSANALNGANGFAIASATPLGLVGESVGSADVNGDGFSDLIIGSITSGVSTTYVVYGKGGAFGASVDLGALNGSNGFSIVGPSGEGAGFAVSSAGDVNGDGFEDLLIGAPSADPATGANAGAAYVVFGKAGGFGASINLATLDGTNGFKLVGEAGFDQAGIAVGGGGDFNGDGYDDILVGAIFNDPNGVSAAGATYVVFGKASGFAATQTVSALGAGVLEIEGYQTNQYSGTSIGFAGDLNNDGGDDIIIGADRLTVSGPGADTGGAYVIYGTPYAGVATNIADTLKSGATGGSLNGLFGADSLFGFNGNDNLNGGDGYALTANGGSVYRLYEATLDRNPDVGGFNSWLAALNGGQSLASITTGFINSPEFQSVFGSLNNTQFVTLLYNNVLDRAPDTEGLNNWVGQLNSGASRESVVNGFSESVEFKNSSAIGEASFATNALYGATSGQVFRLYQATLDRAPDEGGFTNWTAALAGGQSLTSVASGFVNSPEFQIVYGALDNTQFVTLLYNNVLNRAPDTGGLNYWVGQLNGGASRESVVIGFSESPEFLTNSAPGLTTFLKTGLPGYEDFLDGGLGDDHLFGGRGADIFDFAKAEAGNDHVYGYEAVDTLDLRGFGYANAAEALTHFTQAGADVVFSDQGQTITFHESVLATILASTIHVL